MMRSCYSKVFTCKARESKRNGEEVQCNCAGRYTTVGGRDVDNPTEVEVYYAPKQQWSAMPQGLALGLSGGAAGAIE